MTKILGFPFAGGNKYSFQSLFDDKCEAVIFEYPGRGSRLREALVTDILLLIDDLYPKVKKHIKYGQEYCLYGHSLGGIVAFLICTRIVSDPTVKNPQKLVITGSKPPSVEINPFSDLPETLFWDKLDSLGGMPEGVIAEQALKDFYQPILRADVKLFEGYQHQKGNDILTPIDVFYGTDEGISEDEIIKWGYETTSEVRFNKLYGNHFFILKHAHYFRQYFSQLQVH
jgi:external thioesterase TEII